MFASESLHKLEPKKSQTEHNFIKLFTIVSYNVTYKQAIVFISGKPFQPSLVIAGTVEANPSETSFRYSTLGKALGLNHTHTALLQTFINYGCKMLCNIRTREQSYKYFFW
jgi:hypothetical protein